MGWEQTLTPHKACVAFEKKSSLGPANEWLSVMAPNVRKRLFDKKLLGKLAKQLTDQDVLAMGMVRTNPPTLPPERNED
jgi:acid phosphatase